MSSAARNVLSIIFIMLFSCILVYAVLWLSGFIFILLSGFNPFLNVEPLTWVSYLNKYYNNSDVFNKLIVSIFISITIFIVILLVIYFASKVDNRKLYGEARFANNSEISKSGLLGNDGIIIGKWKGKYLVFTGTEFVMVAAETRSGKGVSIVIPNLLSWKWSVVVLDVKQECYMITSKYRQSCGQDVFLFNPFAVDGKTHGYNPLGYISSDYNLRVMDILSIGYSLYSGDDDKFFEPAARNLFLGLCLFLMDTPSLPRTIGELLRQSSGMGKPVKEYFREVIDKRNYKEEEEIDKNTGEVLKIKVPITEWDGVSEKPLSKECVEALERFLGTSDATLASILATFNTPLTLWASPIFDKATSRNDFDLRDIRKKKVSIYLGIPANKLKESSFILNIFYTQLINLNTDYLLNSKPDIKYQCLLLNDEFTAPGMISIIDKANAYMSGYGLRLLTIIQNPGQLEAAPPKGYGKESTKTIVGNHACKVIFPPTDTEIAEDVSRMLGHYTYKSKGKTKQKGSSRGSESETPQKRPLMYAQELSELGKKRQIIKLNGCKPIICDKVRYYEDRTFMDRLTSITPHLDNNKIPEQERFEAVWGTGELACSIDVSDSNRIPSSPPNDISTHNNDSIDNNRDIANFALDSTFLDDVDKKESLSNDEIDSIVTSFFDNIDEAITGSNDTDYIIDMSLLD